MNSKPIKFKKIVLVEGPDNSGKTTLCKEYEKLGYKYYHHSAPEKGKVEEYFKNFYNVLKEHYDKREKVVVDRLFISNWVYSRTFKNTETISIELINKFKEIIGSIVICLPSNSYKYFEEYKKKKDIRGDEWNTMEKIYWDYKKILVNRQSHLRNTIRTMQYDKDIIALNNLSNYVKKLSFN